MNIVQEFTRDHLAYWQEQEPKPVIMGPPADGSIDCNPCSVLLTLPECDGPTVVRVAWRPTDDEITELAAGGTIWLSTWGGLPPHSLEVQAAG